MSQGFVYGFILICFCGWIMSEYPTTILPFLIVAFFYSVYKTIQEINKPTIFLDEQNKEFQDDSEKTKKGVDRR